MGNPLVRTLSRALSVIAIIGLFCAGCGSQNDAEKSSLSAEDLYKSTAPKNQSSDNQKKDSTEQKKKSFDKINDEMKYSSPFDAYFMNADQQQVVQSATDKLTKKCMAKKGYKYQPAAFSSSAKNSSWKTIWGPSDPEDAKLNGYTFQYEDDGNNGNDAASSQSTDTASDENKPGYLHALVNQEDTGCDDISRAALGYNAQWFSQISAFEKARMNADANAINDAKVQSAMSQWSACMKKKGLSYDEPRVIVDSYRKKNNERTIDASERTTAVADAECKVSTDFMKTILTTMNAYETRSIKDNQATMDKIKEISASIFKKAQTELSKPGE
ncbi:MAG: hypothetical protein LKJ44_02625 [Bifidobacteriaceae bacterium]|jgi:hypothetical protein|nr:hypothetical protein [Bifidobacteriaceae bacterium]MCI1978598.1 hypothetical protein [Bifidobacteriaceae bacterium]